MLLQHISLIKITKEFDAVALICATTDDNKHFACINGKYNQFIFANKLMTDADKLCDVIINWINRKRMYFDKILVKIKDQKECKILKDILRNWYKAALYTADAIILTLSM